MEDRLRRIGGTPPEDYGYYAGGRQLYKVLETRVSGGDGSREGVIGLL